MAAFKILHLSDIHIGNTYKPSESIAYNIAMDIDKHKPGSIRCVVVTGDIFEGKSGESTALINEAVRFFQILKEEINSHQMECPLIEDDFIFVPGNHDLIRDDDESIRWRKFRTFLTEFYGTVPDCYDINTLSVVKNYSSEKIIFAGFNSCQIEKRKVFDKKITDTISKKLTPESLESTGINKEQLVSILESQQQTEYDDFGYIPMAQISQVKKRIHEYDDYRIIALFHHHFSLFPEVYKQFGDSSLIRNHAELLNHLRQMNVKTVLHGHKHFDFEKPHISEDYFDTSDGTIYVFSSGSIGTGLKERHTFSIVELYDKHNPIQLVHNKFVYENEILEPIKIKSVPPQNQAVKIVKLLEMLKTQNPDAYNAYDAASSLCNRTYAYCKDIIDWVSSAITGFSEVYSLLIDDYRNIQFLLYAINYRTLCYRNNLEKDHSYFKTTSEALRDYYDKNLVHSQFNISSDKYHELFAEIKSVAIAIKCDYLISESTNKSTKTALALTMVSVYFTDMYLVLTQYADYFKDTIKYKININIQDNLFHMNVPAPRIVINSDADRRSVYVQLLCNNATAHKMAVLFIKEFDLLINRYEDFFKLIGLKLYYILPRIEKNGLLDNLDNYNFEAYIPTLLPLLTGDNIYSQKEVFARELIQNSIDAIAVREAKDTSILSKSIVIDIGLDENGRRYFSIADKGTGMDRHKIERYFTSIGRSFYSDNEYRDLKINYKPISSFGIGFLSSFMVCKEIDVQTKYYLPNSESIQLHIPNYDGCFFIEKTSNIDIGTKIKLYLADNSPKDEQIVNYIKSVMLDVKYDIEINCKGSKSKRISAHQSRKNTKVDVLKFFIPFSEDGNVLEIDYERDIISGEYIENFEYGMLIYPKRKHNKAKNNLVLNAGILINRAYIDHLIYAELKREEKFPNYYDAENSLIQTTTNFPSNWIQTDVSREYVTGFSDFIKEINKSYASNTIFMRIATILQNQIQWIIDNAVARNINKPCSYLHEVIAFAKKLCPQNLNTEIFRRTQMMEYVLWFEIDDNDFIVGLTHRCEELAKNFEAQMSKVQQKLKLLFEQEVDEKNIRLSSKKAIKAYEYRRISYTSYTSFRKQHSILDEEDEITEKKVKRATDAIIDLVIELAFCFLVEGKDMISRCEEIKHRIEWITLKVKTISDVEGDKSSLTIPIAEFTKKKSTTNVQYVIYSQNTQYSV